jgi:hypothetical protein
MNIAQIILIFVDKGKISTPSGNLDLYTPGVQTAA